MLAHPGVQNRHRLHSSTGIWSSQQPKVMCMASHVLNCPSISRQDARCFLQTAACKGLPKSCPLLNSPDSSKTQSSVGTLLHTFTTPRQTGPILNELVIMHKHACRVWQERSRQEGSTPGHLMKERSPALHFSVPARAAIKHHSPSVF